MVRAERQIRGPGNDNAGAVTDTMHMHGTGVNLNFEVCPLEEAYIASFPPFARAFVANFIPQAGLNVASGSHWARAWLG